MIYVYTTTDPDTVLDDHLRHRYGRQYAYTDNADNADLIASRTYSTTGAVGWSVSDRESTYLVTPPEPTPNKTERKVRGF